MKNTTLTVTFNTEKLDALTFHMEKTRSGSADGIKRYGSAAL